MKHIFKIFMFSLLLILGLSQFVFAQNADTVFVPTVYKGSPLGAINNFISGDTTSTGARKNINRFYKLKRDSIYFLSGTLGAKFPLRLIADKPDATHKPAILAQGVLPDGKSLVVFVACSDDGLFENIYFQTAQPTGIGESTITVQALKHTGKYTFKGCYFEWGLFLTIGVYAKDTKMYFEDNYVRNVENATSVWNGRGISFQNNPVDTIIIRNNTFINMNSWFLQGITGLIKYAIIDHNTIVNTVKWPIHWQQITNAVFTNNLFYNVHSYGENAADKVGQDIDGLNFGIFNLFPLATSLGVAENARNIKLHNNNWFYSKIVTDYWTTASLEANPFMNTRTAGMFKDKTKWPLLSELNTTNLDPGFTNVGNGESQMADWMQKMRAMLPTSWWGWDPDKDRFGVTWPLPEKLTYSNPTLLKNADGGFPVGDLNWFPSQKEEWIKWTKSGPAIESNKIAQVGDNFKAIWTVKPSHSPMDGVSGLSKGVAKAFADLGVLVRFKDDHIDAYNKTGYEAENLLNFQAGKVYKIQVIGNVKKKTYTVDVTTEDNKTVRIGTNYVFRSTTNQDTLEYFSTVINELSAFGGVPGSRLSPSFMNNDYELNLVNNTKIAPQKWVFNYNFDIVPTGSELNAAFGFAKGDLLMDEYGKMSTIIRCNSSNEFDARNGAAYSSKNTLGYVPNKKYSVKMTINVAAKSYDVTITPEGGNPVIIADHYAFRATNDTLNTFSKLIITGGQWGGKIGDVLITKNTITDIDAKDISLPTEFTLSQNYPNPFNPETVINYTLPKNSNVSIDVYNTLGQRVITLVNQKQNAGYYNVNWNGKDNYGKNVSSGIYFYQIKADDFIQTKKMILLK